MACNFVGGMFLAVITAALALLAFSPLILESRRRGEDAASASMDGHWNEDIPE